jgi:dCMP deaminase
MDWDQYFINICNVVKLRSKDLKKQVGSCLVSNDNRIISTGYNGLRTGSNDNINWNDRKLVHSLILHAEINVLLFCESKFKNAKLYTTLSPCRECIKIIACSNINKIIYESKYKDYNIVKDICDFYNIELIQFISKNDIKN